MGSYEKLFLEEGTGGGGGGERLISSEKLIKVYLLQPAAYSVSIK